MSKKVEAAVLSLAVLGGLPAWGGNPPEIVQDIYSSSGASYSGNGIRIVSMAGNMLSSPVLKSGQDILVQGFFGVMAGGNPVSGIESVTRDWASGRLAWDSANGRLRVSSVPGESVKVFVSDLSGKLVRELEIPGGAAEIGLGELAAGFYITGVMIDNQIIETIKIYNK